MRFASTQRLPEILSYQNIEFIAFWTVQLINAAACFCQVKTGQGRNSPASIAPSPVSAFGLLSSVVLVVLSFTLAT